MNSSVIGTVRSTGRTYPNGLTNVEIWIPKNKAESVPYVLDQPRPIKLQVAAEVYEAKLRSTTKNEYVWISPTIYSSSGERTTLAAALDQGKFVVNEKVQIRVDGETIVVSKLGGGSGYAVDEEWLLKIAGGVIADIQRASNDLVTVADSTTRVALIEARIGQGRFRDGLVDYWGGCAVTGCSVLTVLTASHIKPWRESSNGERLDLFNGLLLLGTFDLLFDDGLITFDDAGRLIVSNILASHERHTLALDQNCRLRRIESQHVAYLAWHRRHVFRGRE